MVLLRVNAAWFSERGVPPLIICSVHLNVNQVFEHREHIKQRDKSTQPSGIIQDVLGPEHEETFKEASGS